MHLYARNIILFVLTVGLAIGQGWSQKPHYLTVEEYTFRNAQDLFEKQKYAAAQELFDEIVEDYSVNEDVLKSLSEYYAARCAMFLFNDDAEYRLFAFINNHPESSLIQKAILDMALFQYQKKNYRKAITYFKRVDIFPLSDEESAEYYFKLGYSYFMHRDYEKAKMAFYEIKDIRCDYTSPAIYYYAHIAYTEGNYQTALREFRRLSDDASFSAIVPYYIVQILYIQKNYDEIIKYTPPVLEHVTPSRAAEISRYIGDAWFHKAEYEKALSYLEKYAKESRLTRNERYELGYCYYQTGQYDLAVKQFNLTTGPKDLLSQNTYYLLADCFLHLDNKEKASIAFSAATNFDFDPEIKEDALFNYAKLSFELSYSPFNEAIRALKKYIDTYPYSKRVNEAYHYLVLAYLNTKNYRLALESLDQVKEKNDEMKKAYQRVAFYRGLELLKSGDADNAIDMFHKSLQYALYNRTLRARAWYWLGEAYYRLEDTNNALDAYKKFIYSPGAISMKEYVTAHYDLGYIYFNKKQYDRASVWFRKYLGLDKRTLPKLKADTYNRLGDCAFVSRNYKLAVDYYTKAYQQGQSDPDYALFQRGFSYGLLKTPRAKINDLTILIEKFPHSGYLDDALYERGMAYINVNEPQAALKDFREIIYSHTSSAYVPKALLQTGLVCYNQNKYKDAIHNYKQLLEKYPGTSEARNALTGLKNVYVDMNNVDAYFTYARKLGGFANVTTAEEDSLLYISGENLYMSGDCKSAGNVLNKYLKKFPDGAFRVNAHFYLAECARNSGSRDTALLHYQYVIRQPRNLFTAPALLEASQILYERNEYATALEDYVLLEKVAELKKNILTARLGQLRCSYAMNNYKSVIVIAKEIIKMDNISEENAREAYFKMGKSYQALGDNDNALKTYRKVAVEVSSAEGAEAKYRIAELLNKQDKPDEAEKVIMDFINRSTPHQYWMAKAFLLLSDISLQKDDLLQAKYTLRSLMEYYQIKDDGILDEAGKKLTDIERFEKLRNTPGETPQTVPDTIKTPPATKSQTTGEKKKLTV